jgi:hypothetical protein
MYMPGYTAEASLYRTSSAYRATYQPGFGGSAGLIPQGPVVCTECFWDTYDYNVPTCAKLCRRTAPPGQPQPMEYPVPCPESACTPPPPNCCPPGCVQC